MKATAKKPRLGYEELVAECKRLRHLHEKAEAQYFLFLMLAEDQYMETWQEAGCSTFEQFLRSNELCMPDRYRLFKAGVAKSGAEKAAEYGVPWTISIGRIQEASSVEHMAERAQAFLQVNKTAPSQIAVKEWAAEERGREARADEGRGRAQARASELMRLRAENAKLRADLDAAKARIAELEQKVGK